MKSIRHTANTIQPQSSSTAAVAVLVSLSIVNMAAVTLTMLTTLGLQTHRRLSYNIVIRMIRETKTSLSMLMIRMLMMIRLMYLLIGKKFEAEHMTLTDMTKTNCFN